MTRIANLLNDRFGNGRFNRFCQWLFTGSKLPILFVTIYAAVFPICFPLMSWYAVPQTSFASLTNYNGLAAIGLALTGLVLLLMCRRMWLAAQSGFTRSIAVAVVIGWLGASASLLLTYPGQSTDMGDYSFRAHMLVHLGKNPLTTPPSDVITFDAYPYLAWYDVVDPYGPVWHSLAGGLHALVGDDILANFLAFKALAIVATGVCGLFIFAILRRIAPPYAVAGLALWLWNPLVLNEGALNGHNDLVMTAVILAGLWLMVCDRDIPGLITLIAAGLIKITAWLLLPVAVVWLIRQRGWRKATVVLMPSALMGSLLVWLSYAAFGGWQLLLDLAKGRSWWPTGTWTAAIFFALRDGLHQPHATVVSWVIGSATVLFVIVAICLILKMRDLRTCAWSVVLAYLLIAAHWFQPWYATLLMALTAITLDKRLVAYTFGFAFFMLLHPIIAQYFVGQIDHPPGLYDAVMAATTLLVPQILALRLIWESRKRQASEHGNSRLSFSV